jgi:hypothetical protein
MEEFPCSSTTNFLVTYFTEAMTVSHTTMSVGPKVLCTCCIHHFLPHPPHVIIMCRYCTAGHHEKEMRNFNEIHALVEHKSLNEKKSNKIVASHPSMEHSKKIPYQSLHIASTKCIRTCSYFLGSYCYTKSRAGSRNNG